MQSVCSSFTPALALERTPTQLANRDTPSKGNSGSVAVAQLLQQGAALRVHARQAVVQRQGPIQVRQRLLAPAAAAPSTDS